MNDHICPRVSRSHHSLDRVTIFAAPYIYIYIYRGASISATSISQDIRFELHERSYPSRDCIFSASLIPQLFLPSPQFVRPYRLFFSSFPLLLSSRLLLKKQEKVLHASISLETFRAKYLSRRTFFLSRLSANRISER